MKIFLAGAGGAIGRRLTPLLRAVGHTVVGTTRSADKADALRALGAEPVVVDVFDADALARAVKAAAPQAIIHQLTDLAFAPGTPQYEEGLARNARLRVEGTSNLVAAARAANVKRMVAQSIAFAYAPGAGARTESDPLNLDGEGIARRSAEAVVVLEQAVLGLPEGIVLRYGFFYGPGTWSDTASRAPAVHIDAAARATLQALTKAKPGIYNIAEDGDAVSSDKAKQEFGFDAQSRIRMRS
ncbi:MAG: NAD(P)-dependent oxidoreductase [Pseudolabrys sp.]